MVLAPLRLWMHGPELLEPFAERLATGTVLLLLFGAGERLDIAKATRAGVAGLLPDAASVDQILVAIATAFELMDAKGQANSRGKWLNRYRYELGELIEIARALENERDIDKLLELILRKSRQIAGADAGSVYVTDTDPSSGEPRVRFKLSQNDSAAFDAREFTALLGPRSMAGAAALLREPIIVDDAYQLPEGAAFGFDASFDEKTGYVTKSVFCLPLVGRSHEVIGVIQLINKKRDPGTRLCSREDFEREVIPFDERSRELLCTLGAQAGVSLENAMLLEEIRRIFEGFVRASVEAIEQRDPTTSGHSRRVSRLTVDLARAVERTDTGPYRQVVWTREDLREIEYASLLHDFGKIGVREQVLVKAKKLSLGDFQLIRQRLDMAVRSLEVEILNRKLRAIETGASSREIAALEQELVERRGELKKAWALVEIANEPTILEGRVDPDVLERLARQSFIGVEGEECPLLTPHELTCLSTPRGTLTLPELEEIRSHVTHTFNFLSTIPWGKSFRRVPAIAGAHHEKLDGTGYPKGLRGEEIPLQSRLLSIADVFDALTASDRPYKRAVPVDTALEILQLEAKQDHLDAELVRIFCAAKVWAAI